MAVLTVVGVGLEIQQLSFGAADALLSGARVILHTERIGCADFLREKGVEFESLDRLYDEFDDFDVHAAAAASYVAEQSAEQDVVYAVYDVRDRSVLHLARMGVKLRVLAGPPVEGPLLAYLDGATRMLEASDWENFALSPMDNALVRELDSRELASEVKLKLMEVYPDETCAYLLSGDGSVARLPLYDLDRMKHYDHRSCALVLAERDLTKLERFGFDQLVQIMGILQGPEGCAWDKAQSHESLRPFMLEETYEAIDAINQGDTDHLYDELGDILMQVVMHAEIGRQHGEFDISDSVSAICRKMLQRHSHIFGADHADNPEQVLNIWAKNKMKERGQQTHAEVLREVSAGFPALMRGCKLMEKASRAGVAPENREAILRDAKTCLERVCDEKTLGDLLLMICALAKNMEIDAEIALKEASDRFVERFAALEHGCMEKGEALSDKNSPEYWNQVKL